MLRNASSDTLLKSQFKVKGNPSFVQKPGQKNRKVANEGDCATRSQKPDQSHGTDIV